MSLSQSMALTLCHRGPCTGDTPVCHTMAFASVSLQGLQCQAPGLALPQHSVGLTLAAT